MAENYRTRPREAARSDVPSPEHWARRLLCGDPDAVRVVRERVGRILSYGSLEIPSQDRDDLAQEIMTEIWQAVNRSRFDFSAGFWGFVEVVTSRRCIDWLRVRREGASLDGDLVSGAKGPLRQTLEKEEGRLASQVLTSLEPRCRELITLRLRDDLSYGEIAKILGKSEGALRVEVYRCIRNAREMVKRLIEGSTTSEPKEERP